MAARKPKVTPNKAGRYKLTNRTEMGMGAIATDVHSRAVVNAPKDTRALVNSSRIVKLNSGHWVVRFGSRRVRYARIRHFINYKNPQTVNYLLNAGKSVFEGDIKKYFRF